jgi:catechol 2,3-dioxygenase-like lactoylglutathione lyase family enzyme
MVMGNTEFEFRGINHLAFVCRDMAETIEFWEGALGMPLVCTLDLPFGGAQHFFFDAGNETLIAFFWFADAPPAEPGHSAPANYPPNDITSAIGSCNHVALTVPTERFDEHVAALTEKGIAVSSIVNHDDSKWGMSRSMNESVWLRSAYFWDPNGILVEVAALTRPFGPEDMEHDPKDAQGDRVPLEELRSRYARNAAGAGSRTR